MNEMLEFGRQFLWTTLIRLQRVVMYREDTVTLEGALIMKRYFFDLNKTTSSSYDYHGRHFHDAREARDLAEIMALDLSCSETEDWMGSIVKVCDPAGKILFSIPVPPLAKAAA